jgi:plasmid stability protein
MLTYTPSPGYFLSMRRTTVYLDPDLEVQLKLEAMRLGRPMAELLREALRVYLGGGAASPPPQAGAFRSGRRDTAERVDETLDELGFGTSGGEGG